MDIATVTTAYEGLKAGKSILQSLYKTKVKADAKEKIDDVMSKLGEAQDTLFSMREELFRLQADNETLKSEILELELWDNKLSQYELTKTAGGAIVYKFIGTPEHFICPSCVSKKKIEILQDNRTFSGEYRCVSCDAEFPINPRQNIPQVQATSEW